MKYDPASKEDLMRGLWFILFFSVSIHAAIDLPWRSISDPRIMSSSFETRWSELPLSGEVIDKNKYWSGEFWPLNKGSINYRWNHPIPLGFQYKSPKRSEVMQMTREEIAQLAPSEKFDLLVGDYSYSLKKEVSKRASPYDESWEGLCHGQAHATLYHNEPIPRTLTNPDGIEIPFGSSDIKALLSYYYAYKYHPPVTRQMGERCSNRRWGRDRCDHDTNAGAFHIVLTNRVGIQGLSFIADIERTSEVFNHVPYRYEVELLEDNLPPEEQSAMSTVKTIRVKTHVHYVFDPDKSSWEATNGTDDHKILRKTYEYTLDLDENDRIIGGNWISRARPDFLWLPDKAKFPATGRWARLGELLND